MANELGLKAGAEDGLIACSLTGGINNDPLPSLSTSSSLDPILMCLDAGFAILFGDEENTFETGVLPLLEESC